MEGPSIKEVATKANERINRTPQCLSKGNQARKHKEEFQSKIKLSLYLIGVFMGFGTLFNSIMENWSCFKSFYFSYLTLTTIGYFSYIHLILHHTALLILYVFGQCLQLYVPYLVLTLRWGINSVSLHASNLFSRAGANGERANTTTIFFYWNPCICNLYDRELLYGRYIAICMAEPHILFCIMLCFWFFMFWPSSSAALCSLLSVDIALRDQLGVLACK